MQDIPELTQAESPPTSKRKLLWVSGIVLLLLTISLGTIIVSNNLSQRQTVLSHAAENTQMSAPTIKTRLTATSIAANSTTVTLNLTQPTDIANQTDSPTPHIESFSKTKNWIGNEDSANGSYLGLRFSGVAIPANAIIQSAKLSVTSTRQPSGWEIIKVNIYGEANANAPTFSQSNLLSSLPLTTTYSAISKDQKWVDGKQYDFDALLPVQELVQKGYAANGTIALVVKGRSKAFDYYFFYNNQVAGKEPKLVITYTTDIAPTITYAASPTILPTIPQATVAPSPTKVPTITLLPTPTSTSTGWWKPTPNLPTHWHWQLSQDFVYPRDVVPGAVVYDIDGEKTSADTVASLKAMGRAQGKDVKVICYIDVGVYETYRSDAYKFQQANAITKLWGNKDVGWDGSYWLDIRQIDVLKPIMEARIRDWCDAKGFDAVEPDESEVWDNNPGFPITQQQNIAYSKMIADLVHSYGMSVGLKGNNAEAASYEPFSDWSLTEECFQYGECDSLKTAFIDKGKAVFDIEYKATPNCSWANANHMNSAKRDLDLMGPTAGSYLYQPCIPNTQDQW